MNPEIAAKALHAAQNVVPDGFGIVVIITTFVPDEKGLAKAAVATNLQPKSTEILLRSFHDFSMP